MLRHLLFGSVLALSCATLPAAAEVVEHLQQRSYPVSAAAEQRLYEAIDAASPIRQDGRVFHGYTRWDLNWRFATQARSDGRCRITSVFVELRITIDLPELREGSEAQRAAFAAYLPALREHEMGHAQNGRDAAAAIERRIFILPEMRSCIELNQQANQIGQQAVAEFQRRDVQYDQRTQHGKTQGAWLRN